jgi:hypothetical protein
MCPTVSQKVIKLHKLIRKKIKYRIEKETIPLAVSYFKGRKYMQKDLRFEKTAKLLHFLGIKFYFICILFFAEKTLEDH